MKSIDVIDEVLTVLRTADPHDVLVAGYIVRDQGHPQFRSFSRVVYIALESGFLLLESVNNCGQLQIQLTDAVHVPPELEDDDDEFALGSVGNMIFADHRAPFRCTGIRYVTDADSEPQIGRVLCAEFQFETVWRLFADPTWHFGIRLGATGAYEQWHADYFDASAGMVEHVRR